MAILIGLLLFLARLFGWPHEVWEDGSGYVDIVPPTETRWCGASWGAYDEPTDSLSLGCFEYEPLEGPIA